MCCGRTDPTQTARSLLNQCVVVQTFDGRTITGFATAVVNGMLVLTVSGTPMSVPLNRVRQITKATGFAC